ncbi:MAG: DUF2384 domain-containing protein [Opitutales bacterium]|nr:DUF2384 domain-containing protein [Opitutales bacterium]
MTVVIHMPDGGELRVEASQETPETGLAELIRSVEEGVEKSSVDTLAESLGLSKGDVLDLLEIDSSTFSRRRQRLNRHESERVLRLHRLVGEGLKAFDGDKDALKRWFQAPNILLGNMPPLQAARFDFGAREVEKLLARIRTGDFIA